MIQTMNRPTPYAVSVDSLSPHEWDALMPTFGDAHLYQAGAYGTVRFGRQRLSHLVLSRNGHLLAATQVRVFRLPGLKGGLAQVRHGPLHWTDNHASPREVLHWSLAALREEYVERRGMLLRIVPSPFMVAEGYFDEVLHEEGYRPARKAGRTDSTIFMDLRQSEEALLANTKPRWRRYLRNAQKNGIEVVSGTSDELLSIFDDFFGQLVARKGFVEFMAIDSLRDIQHGLPDDLKLRVFVGSHEGKPVSAVVYVAMGKTAMYIHGATADDAMHLRVSYLLHWEAVRWARSRGCELLDLNGVHKASSQGVYQFKSGLAGDGEPVRYFPEYECCRNPLSFAAVHAGEWLRFGSMKARMLGAKVRHSLARKQPETAERHP
ncbi:lipid II:glycine glycyltransferase FemX [Desulfocurvibacter africanus]|uniref:lipid II:glycine glycyltransferase FemX n=1 Tax=Desulfocurvibacter africanus TaxID=873 RepID=UPI0003F824E1|nr:peptidoglycan bridge formation glycyltransferase FemA/FemB family protein [Desulfocurvibacter africanus]